MRWLHEVLAAYAVTHVQYLDSTVPFSAVQCHSVPFSAVLYCNGTPYPYTTLYSDFHFLLMIPGRPRARATTGDYCNAVAAGWGKVEEGTLGRWGAEKPALLPCLPISTLVS
jgi:hypothetical protein